MDLNCPHYQLCSGCSREHHLEKPKAFEEAQIFFLNYGITGLKLRTGRFFEWRSRAKLVTRGTFLLPKIGLFEKGSHRVVDIPLCRVHHPAINRAATILREWIFNQKIELYDEQTGKGFLRYVQLSIERSSLQVQLVLVINAEEVDNAQRTQLQALWSSQTDLWHSLWVNSNTRRDNVIFGVSWKLYNGKPWLWETFLGKDVCFHPGSFVQANLEMFEKLLMRVQDFILPNRDVVEFYAGGGVIGISMVDKCQSIRCVEIAPNAEACFKESCRKLPEALAKRLTFITGTAAANVSLLADAQIVIVDPPRKGLEKEVLEALCKTLNIERLIYISCGWRSFQCDCERLIKNGWKLIEAETFLFFPGTDQIEVLAIFQHA